MPQRPRPAMLPATCAALALLGLAPARGGAEAPDAGAADRPAARSADRVFDVATCAPCTFTATDGSPTYSVRFEPRALPGQRRGVTALDVTRAGRPGWRQTLPVRRMSPVAATQRFLLGAADINFDGHEDLYLATSRGAANTRADYWVFDPGQQAFSPLGNYPVFTLDPATATLSTYERGGHGGLIYTRRTYRFVRGALTVVASEVQEATERPGLYRRTRFRAERGRLRAVGSELVTAPAER